MKVYLLAYYAPLFEDKDYDLEEQLEDIGRVKGVCDGAYLLFTMKNEKEVHSRLIEISQGNHFAVGELNLDLSQLTAAHTAFIKDQTMKG
jgi:hypothetical protein